MTNTTTANCSRCKGKGYGSWVVQNGICFGCNGKGTRAAQIAVREAAKAEARRIAEIEAISFNVEATTRREATMAFAFAVLGPEGSGCLPFFEEVEPGLFATTVRYHDQSLMDWLKEETL